MNRWFKAGFVTTAIGLSCSGLASPTIELKDGSHIQGDVQSIERGVYTIKSSSLGTVRIPQENVAKIVYDGSSNRDNSANLADETTRQVVQIQQRLAQDPDAMKEVMNLQSDPQIQAILNDPAIMQAVEKGDFMSLLGNDKIKALENNARVRQLLEQQGQ